MKHVFLATPVHSGDVPCEYVSSLLDTAILLLRNGVAYTHSFIIGDALVHDARNRLAAWFLASPATDLLFIDADLGWDPAAALRLALSPHDVIGGAYPQKREDGEMYNVAALKPGATGLMQCDYLGAGFLKISRRAFKKLIPLHEDKRYHDAHGTECCGLFEAPIEGGKITGEDALFCRYWREAGGKVFLDPDITFLHVGRKAYRGNFAELMARAPKGEAA